MKCMKFFNNDEGVSPIVATLVLIVVAIIGAAAVGLIMGTFSSNVSNQASSSDVSGQSSATIAVGGSTTVGPLAQLLANAYMSNHTGVKITVSQTGSGMGEVGTGTGAYDIGMASEAVPTSVTSKYPNIQTYTIGASGVVVIVGKSVTNVATGVQAADLKAAYDSNGALLTLTGTLASSGVQNVYTRAEASGTKDAFYKYIAGSSTYTPGTSAHVKTATGNDGVLAAVQADANGLGYVDYGIANTAGLTDTPSTTAAYIVDANVAGTPYAATHANIKLACTDLNNGKTSSTAYPIGLCRPLNYLTNGNPSTIESDFISFAKNPDNEWAFTQCGYESLYDLSGR